MNLTIQQKFKLRDTLLYVILNLYGGEKIMDICENCVHFVADEEFGDYCSVNLDEDEMEKFLTQNASGCHYFQYFDEYKIVRKQN